MTKKYSRFDRSAEIIPAFINDFGSEGVELVCTNCRHDFIVYPEHKDRKWCDECTPVKISNLKKGKRIEFALKFPN
ncbi:MAG: hypothetical protein HRT71_02450 [Flavobacteriales bacterium]|nr:hypothetical protein [Flavobacteriales bacterium]